MKVEKRTSIRGINVLVWLIAGIVISLSVAAIMISGSVNLSKFYNVGDVCEMFDSVLITGWQGAQCDGNEKNVEITQDQATKSFSLYEMQKKWNYILIDIEDLNQSEIPCEINFWNNDLMKLVSQEAVLVEGINCIEVETEMEYSGVTFNFTGQTGAAFQLNSMQFWETMPIPLNGRFVWYAVGVFGVYTILVLLVCKLLRTVGLKGNDCYQFVECIQSFYIGIGNCFGRKTIKIPENYRSIIRKIFFCYMIIHMQVAKNTGWYENPELYKYQILICALIIPVIALFYYENDLQHVNWKNPLVGSWFVLWGMACISDFIVPKHYAWAGYIMLLEVGLFIFIWNNMLEKSKVIKEFATAIRWSFVCNLIFCLLCRPQTEGLRYKGGYFNAVMFGRYLVFAWISILYNIDMKIRLHKKLKMFIPDIILGAAAWTLLWKTQSTSGVVPAIVGGVIFLGRHLFVRQNRKKGLLFLAAVVGMVTCLSVHWGINTIPQYLGTTVKFVNDLDTASVNEHFFSEKVYAAGVVEKVQESRVYKKIFSSHSIESFTSGRNKYWSAYLREMNLFGHERRAIKLWGHNERPHNGILSMGYRYGVFAMIPYVIMLLYNLKYSWKSYRRGNRDGWYLFAVAVCAFIGLMMDNMEHSFLYVGWFCMYFMMGMYFVEDKQEEVIKIAE